MSNDFGIGGKIVGYPMLDSGYLILDSGCLIQDT